MSEHLAGLATSASIETFASIEVIDRRAAPQSHMSDHRSMPRGPHCPSGRRHVSPPNRSSAPDSLQPPAISRYGRVLQGDEPGEGAQLPVGTHPMPQLIQMPCRPARRPRDRAGQNRLATARWPHDADPRFRLTPSHGPCARGSPVPDSAAIAREPPIHDSVQLWPSCLDIKLDGRPGAGLDTPPP